MAALSTHALLDVWTLGRGLHPIDQALALLAATEPDIPSGDHAALTLGERNSRLIALREAIFGRRLEAQAACLQCAERLEFTLSTSDLREQAGSLAADTDCEIEIGGRRLRVHPLTSIDLAAIAGCDDPDRARSILATRCLRDEPEPGGLPPETIDALDECLARCDPQAETVLEMVCPACGHACQLSFDVASFLWTELATEARRLLQEVDVLARRYGWREADILALGSARRRLYLEIAG
jgi:hypothetical protein